MNTTTFLAHHQIRDNPFDAEEARLDPIFDRVMGPRITHPDFGKILGTIDQPATSVVFGEKGSGKTAIRLQMTALIDKHNQEHENRRVLPVAYDDLNPLLDRLLARHKQDLDTVLDRFRLVDHQDAILSLAVTHLTDALLNPTSDGNQSDLRLPVDLKPRVKKWVKKRIKKIPAQKRRDLVVLAALYDDPGSGTPAARVARLRSRLRLRRRLPPRVLRDLAAVLGVVAAVLAGVRWLFGPDDTPLWLLPSLAAALAGGLLALGTWAFCGWRLWALCRRVAREMPATGRTGGELTPMLGALPFGELAKQPLPQPNQTDQAGRDSRYQLTRRLLDAIAELGYVGLVVMVDRVDEPTAVAGDPDRMRAIVWPMLDNKFLKQDRIGLKLLLPIELHHLLAKESSTFFQEARLDKQNLIEKLEWSGVTLYDLCSARLRACRTHADNDIALLDLFDKDVSRDALIAALDQMHQPRDAFKFLYAVIQEHCRLTGEDHPIYRIPRLVLETARRTQSQRVQDLHRGLGPA